MKKDLIEVIDILHKTTNPMIAHSLFCHCDDHKEYVTFNCAECGSETTADLRDWFLERGDEQDCATLFCSICGRKNKFNIWEESQNIQIK